MILGFRLFTGNNKSITPIYYSNENRDLAIVNIYSILLSSPLVGISLQVSDWGGFPFFSISQRRFALGHFRFFIELVDIISQNRSLMAEKHEITTI